MSDGRPVAIAVFDSIKREGAFEEIEHGSDLVGKNVVFVNPPDFCCPGAFCPWCNALKIRLLSRVGRDT